MSTPWHDDIFFLVVTFILMAAIGVVYLVLKKRRPNDPNSAVLAKAEKWVEGVFFAALIAGAIFLTVRYS